MSLYPSSFVLSSLDIENGLFLFGIIKFGISFGLKMRVIMVACRFSPKEGAQFSLCVLLLAWACQVMSGNFSTYIIPFFPLY